MSRHDGEDLPGLGYALQLMRAPALEPERRSSNEIFDRPRDEDFARSRKSRDPSADVHDAIPVIPQWPRPRLASGRGN